MRDVGQHLSIQQCMDKCLAAGPQVCANLEYGRSNIGYNCRMWTGTCQYQPQVNSLIYVPNHATYGTTHVGNYQAMGETNFNNSANRGDTTVDNLVGTQGSVQNFGLIILL